MQKWWILALTAAIGLWGCGGDDNEDGSGGEGGGGGITVDAAGGGGGEDGMVFDMAIPDATTPDGAIPDAMAPDAMAPDAMAPDAMIPDEGILDDTGVVPPSCDQPDPVSCDAAGCIWTRDGCNRVEDVHECWRYNMAVCNSRDICVWMGNHCEPDPAGLECGELDPNNCILRADCTWVGNGCADTPEGPCPDLNEAECRLRPECESVIEDEAFVMCRDRVLDCRNVPLEACERTPSCHIEEIPTPCAEPCACDPNDENCACLDLPECPPQQVCVPDEAGPCDRRGLDICEIDDQCILEEAECGGGAVPPDERRAPPPPDGAEAPPADPLPPPPEPCEPEIQCVPNPQVDRCEGLEPQMCLEVAYCQVGNIEVCDCDQPPPPPPPPPGGREPARRAPPPDRDIIECPCFLEQVCQPMPMCDNLGQRQCNMRADCGWGQPVECNCAEALPPECPPDDPNCVGAIAPPCDCLGCYTLDEVCAGQRDGGCNRIPGCAWNGRTCEAQPVNCDQYFDEFACGESGACQWQNGPRRPDALVIAPPDGACVPRR